MGLEVRGPRAIYLTIMNGKIVQQVPEGTPNAVPRVNKNQVTVHELLFDQLTGHIVDISVREREEYGKEWNVKVKDGDDHFVVSMPYSGGYSQGFLYRLPNVDFSRPVSLSPFTMEKDGKKRAFLMLYQDGNKVESYFSRETPNGLPELKKTVFRGKEEWDDTERMGFLQDMVENKILPRLKKEQQLAGHQQAAPTAAPSAASYTTSNSVAGDNEPDDLPF